MLGDLGILIFAKYFKKLPKVQKSLDLVTLLPPTYHWWRKTYFFAMPISLSNDQNLFKFCWPLEICPQVPTTRSYLTIQLKAHVQISQNFKRNYI